MILKDEVQEKKKILKDEVQEKKKILKDEVQEKKKILKDEVQEKDNSINESTPNSMNENKCDPNLMPVAEANAMKPMPTVHARACNNMVIEPHDASKKLDGQEPGIQARADFSKSGQHASNEDEIGNGTKKTPEPNLDPDPKDMYDQLVVKLGSKANIVHEEKIKDLEEKRRREIIKEMNGAISGQKCGAKIEDLEGRRRTSVDEKRDQLGE